MKVGYIDGVAWEYEIGRTDVQVFPTLRALKESLGPTDERRKSHFKQCGYTKVKLVPLKRKHGTVA